MFYHVAISPFNGKSGMSFNLGIHGVRQFRQPAFLHREIGKHNTDTDLRKSIPQPLEAAIYQSVKLALVSHIEGIHPLLNQFLNGAALLLPC